MKRFCLVSFLFMVILTFGVAGSSLATVINFDNLVDGDYLSDQYISQGVVFSNNNGPLGVYTWYPGPGFSSPNIVWPDNFYKPGNKNKATFSIPVNFVSVVMGDQNYDDNELWLKAYNSSHNLIASDYDWISVNFYGGKTLSVLAPEDISYVEFWGVGSKGDNNDVAFDNFEFSHLPEPGTLVLLGTGLSGFAIYITLRRKKKS